MDFSLRFSTVIAKLKQQGVLVENISQEDNDNLKISDTTFFNKIKDKGFSQSELSILGNLTFNEQDADYVLEALSYVFDDTKVSNTSVDFDFNFDFEDIEESAEQSTSEVKNPLFINFLEDKNNILLFDKDNDGVLTDEEISIAQNLLMVLSSNEGEITQNGLDNFAEIFSDVELAQKAIATWDENSDELSINDFAAFQEYVNGVFSSVPEFENPVEVVKNMLQSRLENSDEISILQEMGVEETIPLSEVDEIIETEKPQNSTNTTSTLKNSPHKPSLASKNLDNMSIADLENELSVRKEAENQAFSAYNDLISSKNNELAQKQSDIRTKLDTLQTEFDEINLSLTGVNSHINQLKSKLSTINSKLSKAQKDKTINVAELNSKKGEILAEIEELNAQKEQLEAKKAEKETELNEIKAQMSDVESEIAQLVASDSQIQALKAAYDKAVELTKEAQDRLNELKQAQEKTKYTTAPDLKNGETRVDYRDRENPDFDGDGIVDKYDFTNMPNTMEIKGYSTFNLVAIPSWQIDSNGDGKADTAWQANSWEELGRYFKNAGIENVGAYGTMQCHNYSNALADFIMGTMNSDIVDEIFRETNGITQNKDEAGRRLTYINDNDNVRDGIQVKSKDRTAGTEIIMNELQNGIPAIVSVPYDGGCHYVAAVGMNKDGEILYWDSYSGKFGVLGGTSNNGKLLTRNQATGNSVMIVSPGYRYHYNTGEYISYWDDAVGVSANSVNKTAGSHNNKGKNRYS